MNEQSSSVKPKAKPYPRQCSTCGEVSVSKCQIPYNAEIRHDGELHAFSIESLGIDRCERCGEQFFTTSTDEEIGLALRTHLGAVNVMPQNMHTESSCSDQPHLDRNIERLIGNAYESILGSHPYKVEILTEWVESIRCSPLTAREMVENALKDKDYLVYND